MARSNSKVLPVPEICEGEPPQKPVIINRTYLKKLYMDMKVGEWFVFNHAERQRYREPASRYVKGCYEILEHADSTKLIFMKTKDGGRQYDESK